MWVNKFKIFSYQMIEKYFQVELHRLLNYIKKRNFLMKIRFFSIILTIQWSCFSRSSRSILLLWFEWNSLNRKACLADLKAKDRCSWYSREKENSDVWSNPSFTSLQRIIFLFFSLNSFNCLHPKGYLYNKDAIGELSTNNISTYAGFYYTWDLDDNELISYIHCLEIWQRIKPIGSMEWLLCLHKHNSYDWFDWFLRNQ